MTLLSRPHRNADAPDSHFDIFDHRKFYLAYTMQFVMGSLFIIAIFTLVVQSTTVVGMFLNFAALEFITGVDDVAFALGKRGYFTNSIKVACDEVNEMVYLRRKGGRLSRRIQILIITASVLGLFGLIVYQEEQGQFDCRRIEVQFGDGFSKWNSGLDMLLRRTGLHWTSHSRQGLQFSFYSPSHYAASLFRHLHLSQRILRRATNLHGREAAGSLSILCQW